MGKRQLGEMEPFELVITLIIADLATIPMAEQTIPIWYGVIPLLVITVVHFIFSFITQKSAIMRDIISGKPVIVIDEGNISVKELKSLNMSTEELMEQLRNLNYFDISGINYAIVERNGKITVIPKAASMPATREDHKFKPEESEIQYNIIESGKVIKRNFKEMNLQHKIESTVSDIIHKMSCNLEDIIFACISEGGDVYAQKNGGEMQNFKIKIPTNTEAKILDAKEEIV
ncbi:MAG: DUF421 domain-containing protein [Firmicutes bacterium]|nr:DUF421 domain-containing protein [Bacillota bacterium]